MKKFFTVICPICECEIKTPMEYRYIDYSQECPECGEQFQVTEDEIKQEEPE